MSGTAAGSTCAQEAAMGTKVEEEVSGSASSGAGGVGAGVGTGAGAGTAAAAARTRTGAGAAAGTGTSAEGGGTGAGAGATTPLHDKADAGTTEVPAGLGSLMGKVVKTEPPMVVLMAGEHWQLTTGERMMGSNHCSLVPVAQAYAKLVDVVGRDNMIVIAQVEEVLTWLRKAARTGEPKFSPRFTDQQNKDAWQRKLDTTLTSCARLIADGGAHYDGTRVNPTTFYNVLVGKPTRAGDKVVPVGRYRALLVGIYSHGWSHDIFGDDEQPAAFAKYRCDICKKPHAAPPPPSSEEAKDAPVTSTQRRVAATTGAGHDHSSMFTREWYFHCPHEAEDGEELYAFAAHAQHEHHRSLVYWSTLFRAYHTLVCAAPRRPILALHNFCGAAGTLKFMDNAQFRKRYKLQQWPLYLMCASGELEGALPGGVWFKWVEAAASCLNASPRSRTTVHELFTSAKASYMAESAFMLVDKVMLGFVARDAVLMELKRMLTHALGRAVPDDALLQRAHDYAQEHGVTRSPMCWHCHTMFASSSAGLCTKCSTSIAAMPADQRPHPPVADDSTRTASVAAVDVREAVRRALASTHGVAMKFGEESRVQDLPFAELFG